MRTLEEEKSMEKYIEGMIQDEVARLLDVKESNFIEVAKSFGFKNIEKSLESEEDKMELAYEIAEKLVEERI